MLEILASQHSEPQKEFYVNGASIDDAQHAANWHDIEVYLQKLRPSNLHLHVPLLNNKPTQSAATYTSSAREKTVYDILI